MFCGVSQYLKKEKKTFDLKPFSGFNHPAPPLLLYWPPPHSREGAKNPFVAAFRLFLIQTRLLKFQSNPYHQRQGDRVLGHLNFRTFGKFPFLLEGPMKHEKTFKLDGSPWPLNISMQNPILDFLRHFSSHISAQNQILDASRPFAWSSNFEVVRCIIFMPHPDFVWRLKVTRDIHHKSLRKEEWRQIFNCVLNQIFFMTLHFHATTQHII